MERTASHAISLSGLDPIWQGPMIIRVVLAGEALAIILTLAASPAGAQWVHFGLASLVIQWIALTTLGALRLLRAPLARLPAHFVAYFALALLMISTLCVCGLTWLAVRDVWPVAVGEWQQLLLRLSGISLTVGLLALAVFQGHLHNRRLAVLAMRAEMEALQARIRPHFLFNTLNTGAALVHAKPDSAEQLLLDLADLFRAALGGPETLPLEDELALARRYLEIESLRFGDRLQVGWHLPDPLPRLQVPTLSIQPLVENAIHHGIESRIDGGAVSVSVESVDRRVIVEIRNTCAPTGASSGTPHQGHRIGLRSVQTRVATLTDGRGEVTTRMEGDLFIARISMPAD